MVCGFKDFPLGKGDGQIPVCEINEEVLYSSPDLINLHVYTSSVSELPNVIISRDVLQPSLRRPGFEGQVFLPTSTSLIQRLQDAWYVHGLFRVLQVLSEEPSLRVGRLLAGYCLLAYTSLNHVKRLVFPPTEESESSDAPRRAGGEGPVVCLAWHPSATKLALATVDESVSIYSAHARVTPVLKAKTQRRITDLAWRPLTGGELAVASADGINIWHVDPNSLIARPSPSSVVLLPHSYVTSIAWSPQGDILVSCNGLENKIVVWNVDSKERLSMVYPGGATFLLWNPFFSKLLAPSRTKVFRLWSTEKWDCESWTTAGGGFLTAGCWSGDGTCLLFSTSSLPYLYSLRLAVGPFSQPSSAVIVADLTQFSLPYTDYVVGGEVERLDWDAESRRVAVMFRDSQVIAVYLSHLSSTLQLIPGFFIRGLVGEIPTSLAFQKDFPDGGNLTISWSTGRVQYFPMVYKQNVSLPLSRGGGGGGQFNRSR